MSDEERRAIAARGSGFQQGKGEISDKGAKDFKEGMGSIEKASKTGGLMMLVDMFMKMADITENPMLKVIISFFELFGTFLNSAGAENAKILAEALFTEENVQIMEDLAKATNEAMLSTEELTNAITAWTVFFGVFTELTPVIELSLIHI